MIDEDLVTATQAARAIGRPVNTVRAWAHTGKLERVYALRGVNYYRLSDVRAVAEACAARPGNAKIVSERANREPTEAELEEMIAQQMKSLPAWWAGDVAAMRARNPDGGALVVRVFSARGLEGVIPVEEERREAA